MSSESVRAAIVTGAARGIGSATASDWPTRDAPSQFSIWTNHPAQPLFRDHRCRRQRARDRRRRLRRTERPVGGGPRRRRTG